MGILLPERHQKEEKKTFQGGQDNINI